MIYLFIYVILLIFLYLSTYLIMLFVRNKYSVNIISQYKTK